MSFALGFASLINEIMVINGAIVSDLDMMFIESVLQEELTLCMMLRSARTGNFFVKLQHELKFHKIFFKMYYTINTIGKCDCNSFRS